MDTSLPQDSVVFFLDFDDVIRAVIEACLDSSGRLIPSPALFRWHPELEEILEPHPEVRIIISCSWRCFFDEKNLARVLGPSLGPRLIGIVEDYGESRAAEIIDEANRRGITRWLAVDDHPSVAEARKLGDTRFIVCQPDTGLSAPQVQQELRASLARLSAGEL